MTPGSCSNEYQSTGGSFCQSCFASFVLHGCSPDRPCITDVEDDGKPETTLILRNGDYQRVVTITDENREQWAYGGWPGWVQYLEQLPRTPAAATDDGERSA
jgi:hypothetical protein